MADGGDGALSTVQTIITAKIANSRVILLRAAREISDETRENSLREAANRLSWAGLEAARAPPSMRRVATKGRLGKCTFQSSIT